MNASRGQAIVEYLILCATVALVLGVSWSDHGSVAGMLLDALRTLFADFSYALSMPT